MYSTRSTATHRARGTLFKHQTFKTYWLAEGESLITSKVKPPTHQNSKATQTQPVLRNLTSSLLRTRQSLKQDQDQTKNEARNKAYIVNCKKIIINNNTIKNAKWKAQNVSLALIMATLSFWLARRVQLYTLDMSLTHALTDSLTPTEKYEFWC